MTRKRAPPKRPSSVSNGFRHHNGVSTEALIKSPQPHGVFGGSSELGGMMRAVLLGAVVGGVVAFLLYPDITRLLQHLNGVSSSTEPPSVSSSSPYSKDASGQGQGQRGSDPGADDHARTDEKDPGRVPNSPRNPHNKQDSSKGKRASKISESKEQGRKPTTSESGKENAASAQCASNDCSDPSTKHSAKPRHARSTKNIAKPKEDLMEGEEEEDDDVEFIEEEDPEEVVLMEVDEPEDYIRLTLQAEEEEAEEQNELNEQVPETIHHEGKKGAGHTTPERIRSQYEDASQVGDEDGEAISIEDGQPISFRPVAPGDEDVIRIGGRPKDGSKDSRTNPSADRKDSTAAKQSAKQSANVKTMPKETDDSAQQTKKSSQRSDSGKSKSKKPKSSKSKSASTKEASPSQAEAKPDKPADDDQQDLPDEVKNFKPTYLKTVTAKKIFADGRRIPPVELIPQKETNSSVKVYLFNDFLSEEECDGLRRVHDKHVTDMAQYPLLCFSSLSTLRKHLDDVNITINVTPNDFVEGTRCVNASFSRQLGKWLSGNWSYSTAFYPGESRFSDIFASRVEQAMGLDPRNGGKFQITSYPTGKAYKAHTDCVLDGKDKRDRVVTVLVYLDDVEDGGETKFPELDVWVKPRKGRALVWNNMSPEGVCEPHSLHVASKVNKGSKYILIRWYYYKSFYSLGRRPPEPLAPSRPAGTPRVSCDDYDNGSCRWYDEWNMDHLNEYEAKKYTLI